MICPICGIANVPDARKCSQCGFLLAWNQDADEVYANGVAGPVRASRRPVSNIERLENSRLGTFIVLLIVLFVIFMSIYVLVRVELG